MGNEFYFGPAAILLSILKWSCCCSGVMTVSSSASTPIIEEMDVGGGAAAGWSVVVEVGEPLATAAAGESAPPAAPAGFAFLAFMRRFWNQILIWRSVRPRLAANSVRRGRHRYLEKENLLIMYVPTP